MHAASGRGRTTALTIEDVRVSVVRKRVKNVNFRVYPPAGDVVVSVPLRMSDSVVLEVLTGRLPWIRLQRSRYASAPPARFLEYVDGEEHRLFGRCYTLRLVHGAGRTGPSATDRDVVALHVRPFADHDARRRAHEAWLRRVLATEIERLVAEWSPRLGVEVAAWGVKRMKTRWGTCNHRARRIRLNLDLVTRPPACLEYVVVHELAHILVPDHSRAFWDVLDTHMPHWRRARTELGRWPLWADGPLPVTAGPTR